MGIVVAIHIHFRLPTVAHDAAPSMLKRYLHMVARGGSDVIPKVPVSALPLWLSLRDWRLAAGSGLVPSIQVFRSVRDYSQRA
jgi:hypothetical protein